MTIVNECAHERLICSSGWRCLVCGASLETIRWELEQRDRRALTDALNRLADVAENLARAPEGRAC